MEIFYIFHYVMQMVMLNRMHLRCQVQSFKYKIFIIVFNHQSMFRGVIIADTELFMW